MIRRIWSFLYTNKDVSIDEYKRIIDSFPEPKDDYDRVYYSYKVNRQYKNILAGPILGIIGLLGILFLTAVYSVNRLRCVKPSERIEKLVINATNRFGTEYGISDKLPDNLDKDDDCLILKTKAFPGLFDGILTADVFTIWMKFVSRHPFSFWINFRCIHNLAGYGRLLYEYRPKRIYNSRVEVNNLSSLVSLLCESNECEYIAFMHGSIMRDPLTAFVRFSKFYLWDSHYECVLDWARCEKSQYRFYEPEFIKSRKMHPEAMTGEKILTYYFSGSTETCNDINAKEVIRILDDLSHNSFKCYVRPHPRWSNCEEVKEYVKNTKVNYEEPKEITMNESLSRTNYCVGQYSTVLLEALYTNNTIVIDDLTDKVVYKNLVKEDFIILKKEHILLSKLISYVG